MMTWNLSDEIPRPRPGDKRPPRRQTPCAGLFGWRKDGGQPPGKDDLPDRKPGPDYPAD